MIVNQACEHEDMPGVMVEGESLNITCCGVVLYLAHIRQIFVPISQARVMFVVDLP